MKYYELWMVLGRWKKEFSVKDFKAAFFSPDSNKVLHDMAKKGLLEKTGWGRYRARTPEEVVMNRADIGRGYEMVKEAGMKYAFTGPDSVFFWTNGGYQTGRFFGFYPIHVKIKRINSGRWKSYFSKKGKHAFVYGERPKDTVFGLFYILYPERDFKTAQKNGFSVDSLKEAVEYCKANIYAYEPALEMLNDMYKLGLKIRYREIVE